MGHTIVNHKRLQAKARTHTIEHLYGGCYKVVSGSSGQWYSVRQMIVKGEEGAACSCQWGGWRGWADIRSGCSHVLKLYLYLYGPERVIAAWATEEDAQRQHRPYIEIGDGTVVTVRVKDW